MKRIFFLLALLLQLTAGAQTVTVIGRVLTPAGAPLTGVSVAVKESPLSTATDTSGYFRLIDVPASATLIFSFVGYASIEVPLAGRTSLTITMDHNVKILDEAIVIAYGTTTRRLATGNISKVGAAEIGRQPVSNPLAALQGRAAGVFVSTGNGLPGGSMTLQIRGRTSVAAGTDPLYIVDGVPFNASPLNLGLADFSYANESISPLNSLNPSDIESIEILKDADATALYGSRASNGVVLITTKKGREGPTKVTVSLSQGISRVGRFAPFLGVSDYLALRREAFANDDVVPTLADAPDLLLWDSTQTTDWQKYIMGRTAPVTDAQVALSGGSRGTSFLLRASYRNEGSVLRGDHHYGKGGVHLNLQHAPTGEALQLALSASYTRDENQQPGSVLGYFTLPPHFPVYNQDGAFNWSLYQNPEAALMQRTRSHTETLISQANLTYKLAEGLSIRAALGYTQSSLDQWSAKPLRSNLPLFGEPNAASFGNHAYQALLAEPQLSYSRHWRKTVLSTFVGSTWQHIVQDRTLLKVTHYSNESLMENMSAGSNIAYTNNRYTEYKYVSVFGRVNLRYADRYLLNGSFRRDGSSRFGAGQAFGHFGALGAAWIFSEEALLQKYLPFLSFGKLRGSFGRVGNDQIPDYGYLSTYGTASVYGGLSTLGPARLANPDYSWENTHKWEAALDLGFWDNRLLTTVAWYRSHSDNQLVDYPLPSQAGFTTYQANLPALVQNKGWEFTLQTTNLRRGDWQWTTTANLTLPHNRLLRFPGLEGTTYANQLVVGEDIGVVQGFRFLGVDSQTGLPQYEDVDKDGILNMPQDYVVLGATSPQAYGGLGNTISFKNFQLDIFIQGVRQKGFTEAAAPGLGISNRLAFVLDRWRAPGDVTSIPRATATSGHPAYDANALLSQSSAVFTDASYLRLKNVSLSYRFKLQKFLSKEEGRLYLQGQNLFTIADKTRVDPELTNGTGVPPLQSLVAGFQLTF